MDRFKFKLLLVVFMIFDHVYMFLPPGIGNYAHIITRFVSVGFAYLAVEGFLYTRDAKKYIGRMYACAAVMFAGNSVLNHLFASRGVMVDNNIFLTLALGLSALAALKYVDNRVAKVLLGVVALAASFMVEGGYVVVPFMMLTYVFWDRPVPQYLSYLVLSGAVYLLLFGVGAPQFLLMNCDFMFITVIPLLMLYNHEEGIKTRASKYFFYVFYPLHLWLIALAQFVMA